MKTITCVAVLAISFSTVAFAAEHPGAAPAATAAASSEAGATTAPAAILDGKAFKGTISKEGQKKKGDKDELVFKDGTFRSTACDKYGFTETAYTAHEEAGKTTFEATATNKEGEKMEWKGTIAGDKAAAAATFVNAKGKTEKYGFQGDAKK